MRSIAIRITNEPINEPVNITIVVDERDYSAVKLYIPKVDGKPSVLPGKVWYVYFYYRNAANKMQKVMDTCKINRYKSVQERKKAGLAWVKSYEILLLNGYNPFSLDGVELQPDSVFDQQRFTLRSALDYALENKRVKEATKADYNTRKNVFLDWAKKHNIQDMDILKLNEVHIVNFMNWLTAPKPKGRDVSKTSQDNYKRCLSSLFAKLVKDKILKSNPVEFFETSKDKPLKNTPFTGFEAREIRDYLKENDPQLYHFIQFVIYPFLRPREIVRLVGGDIHFEKKCLIVDTKTDRRRMRSIFGPVLEYLQEIKIDTYPDKAHIFTNTGKPEIWETSEKSKVDHFGNRFKKVKLHFGFSSDYGIYSFRHTAAIDLYHAFMKEGITHREAVLRLMPIIDHSNEKTTEKYLRDVGAMLPKDYGHFYTLDF